MNFLEILWKIRTIHPDLLPLWSNWWSLWSEPSIGKVHWIIYENFRWWALWGCVRGVTNVMVLILKVFFKLATSFFMPLKQYSLPFKLFFSKKKKKFNQVWMEKSFLLNYPTLGKELQRLQSKSGKFYMIPISLSLSLPVGTKTYFLLTIK